MAHSHSRRKLDLTGQRYGHLTVLSPAPNVSGRTAWRCLCDCGRETVVQSHRLRSGRTASCGCLYGYEYNHWPADTPRPPGTAGRASLTYVDGTCVEMLRAKTVRRNNTSGVPGVEWVDSKRRWRATICFKGRRHYLGSYAKFEEAVEARKRGEAEFHDSFLRGITEESAQHVQPPAGKS